jgi:hypothetical protein
MILNYCSESAKFSFERAPEPTDVYWENLNITSLKRYFRIFVTYSATVIMILACFGIIYLFNIWKINAARNKGYGSIVISWICSFVIIGINEGLTTVVRTLSIKEKHETYTAYNLSVAFKLTLTRFINTAIVPCIVNIHSERWFVEGGLVSDIFSIMISLSFIDPVSCIIDIGAIKKYLKRLYYQN